MKKRSGDPRDAEIGRRIRALRLERGLSQGELGNFVGLTFQQIQQYEMGATRVAAARLERIAEMFGVPITFFYTGPEAIGGPTGSGDSVNAGLEFLDSAGAVRLVRAYSKIHDPGLRRALVELTECLAGRADFLPGRPRGFRRSDGVSGP
jgi:transcriptional regulator with XRE-family HTH domain